MKTLSNIINIGSIILITAMIIITIALIRVTIGFNIKLHQEEIEIMHLVGSSDKFIRTPFILEGALYGFIAGLISGLFILIPWYITVFYTRGSDFGFWFEQLFRDFNMAFLTEFNLLFILLFLLVHIIVGSLVGLLSSYSAVKKYLNE